METDWERRSKEFMRRMNMGATASGISQNCMSSPTFNWMLEPLLDLVPPAERHRFALTRQRNRTFKDKLIPEELEKTLIEISTSTKTFSVLYDAWKPPRSDTKILATGFAYQHGDTFRFIPFSARCLQEEEVGETGATVSKIILEAAQKLVNLGVCCISVHTDNASNVRNGAKTAVSSHLRQQEDPFIPGSANRGKDALKLPVSADWGCLSHQNALVIKSLLGPEAPRQFRGLVDTVVKVRKFVRADFVSRIYKSREISGRQILEPVDTRWMYALLSIQSLLRNWDQVAKLLTICRSRHWEKLSTPIRELHNEAESALAESGLRERMTRTLESLWVFKELSDSLQSASSSFYEGLREMSKVYEQASQDPFLSDESRRVIRERFSKASQERGWVLLFDPEERLESPSARREKLDIAIREVRRSSDTEDIVSLNDSLGIITDFFFLEGLHGTTPKSSFRNYWAVFCNECSVSRFLYLSSVIPSGTQELERAFSAGRHVMQTNRGINEVFGDVLLRYRTNWEVQSSTQCRDVIRKKRECISTDVRDSANCPKKRKIVEADENVSAVALFRMVNDDNSSASCTDSSSEQPDIERSSTSSGNHSRQAMYQVRLISL